MDGHLPSAEVHDLVSRLVEMFDAPGVFSEAFVDELRAVIAWCEAGAGQGIVTAYETYEAWYEHGRETTAVHPVQVATSEARQLCALLDDLRVMAGLVERTLDLVAAQAIVTGLRADSWSSTPWGGQKIAPAQGPREAGTRQDTGQSRTHRAAPAEGVRGRPARGDAPLSSIRSAADPVSARPGNRAGSGDHRARPLAGLAMGVARSTPGGLAVAAIARRGYFVARTPILTTAGWRPVPFDYPGMVYVGEPLPRPDRPGAATETCALRIVSTALPQLRFVPGHTTMRIISELRGEAQAWMSRDALRLFRHTKQAPGVLDGAGFCAPTRSRSGLKTLRKS